MILMDGKVVSVLFVSQQQIRKGNVKTTKSNDLRSQLENIKEHIMEWSGGFFTFLEVGNLWLITNYKKIKKIQNKNCEKVSISFACGKICWDFATIYKPIGPTYTYQYNE